MLNYKNVIFDDYTKNDDGTYWSQICQHCVDKSGFKNELDDTGSGICGVEGCENESDYYIDFPENIQIEERVSEEIQLSERRILMSRIDTSRYKPAADNPGKLEYAGQKTAREVFNELQYRLKADGYLPDEYLLFDNHLDNGEPFPDDADIMCNVNWGSSEGIYLDIMLRYQNEKGEMQYKNFATGKTLGETENDLDRMYLIASACTKAFHSPGVHSRFIFKEEEKNSAKAPKSVSCAPTVLHLNEREKKLVTESLIEMRTRYKAEKRPLEEIEQLLRRIIGTITEYIKAVGERPQNLDYGDIAALAIADGNREDFKTVLPYVPHLYGNLLNEAVNRPDEYGRQMAQDVLTASKSSLSNDIYKQACTAAIRNNDTESVLTLMKNAEKCVSALDKEFYGDVLLQSFSSRNQQISKDIVSEMTANQVKDADPYILKIALMEKSYDVAKELVYKGIDVASGSAMFLYTAAKQKNVEFAHLLLDHGADPDGQKSAALSACMETNDIPSAMFMLVCGADFNKFMDTISDKFENGKLSENESGFVFAVKSFWENNILKGKDIDAEADSEFEMEKE